MRALGDQVAIDDFGTGYSSFELPQAVPAGYAQDRPHLYQRSWPRQRRPRRSSDVALAGILDLVTTAEGVENEMQYQHLRALGCQLGQGYLFGRPVPAAELFRTSRARVA